MKRSFIICGVLIVALLSSCQSSASEEAPPINSSVVGVEETLTPTPDPTPTPIPTESITPQREDADFRNAKWGDSKETVLEYETEIELMEIDNTLIGPATVNAYDTYAMYFFNDNILYGGGYSFNLEYSNAGQYIPVYNSLKETLTQKYGEPTEDVIIPLASQSLIEMAGDAQALEYGYVTYRARWETNTTDITLGMAAQNFEVSLLINYEDKNYEPDINDSGL